MSAKLHSIPSFQALDPTPNPQGSEVPAVEASKPRYDFSDLFLPKEDDLKEVEIDFLRALRSIIEAVTGPLDPSVKASSLVIRVDNRQEIEGVLENLVLAHKPSNPLTFTIPDRIEEVLNAIDNYFGGEKSFRKADEDCPSPRDQKPTRPEKVSRLRKFFDLNDKNSDKNKEPFIPKSKVREALEKEHFLFAEVSFPANGLALNGYICFQNQEGRVGIYFSHSVTGEVMSTDIELASVTKLRKLNEIEKKHFRSLNGFAAILLAADGVEDPSLRIF